eukprot:CAMPEP_0170453446 /NCGR_PEP_ID=MMETSP0123-20130129/2021_1 /TAXON_ID=182087 /ORGANISM="Favella ehrenbergii, Strain Fehren 1" /LENGTH=102 /DNA_ID=CAMNT_0010715813 /DNA_START=6 /DNA_END=314 /DNA_ORIENTATION=+
MEVVSSSDPSVNVYQILEDRQKQEEPFTMADYYANIYFYFIGHDNLPVVLSPRIGVFKIIQYEFAVFDGETTLSLLESQPVVEVDLKTDERAANLFIQYKND